MWQRGSTASMDSSTAMGSFVEASEWLSERVGQNDVIMVSSTDIFRVINPQWGDRLVDFVSIWNQAGVYFHERASPEKLYQVQQYFVNFLNSNRNVRYVVRDWVDPYATYLFEGNDQLSFVLTEVKVINFTLSNGYSNHIIIYENV
jgi:hypothetical protein